MRRDAITRVVLIDDATVGSNVGWEKPVGGQAIDEPFENGREGGHKAAFPRSRQIEVEEPAKHDRLAFVACEDFNAFTQL